MTAYTFNTGTLEYGPKVGDVPVDQLPSTPTLRRAPLNKAVLFGGPLVAAVLESCPLEGDRDHVLVDTKVSHLLPGFYPSIPGWHTDGVPRHFHPDPVIVPENDDFSPFFYGAPSQAEQLRQHEEGYYPRYHSVHVGLDCPTEFLMGEMELDLLHAEDERLYAEMTQLVEERTATDTGGIIQAPYGQWLSWDWWQIHRAIKSSGRGFRLWIRVTECNDPPLQRDFILRPQNQIYVDGQDQAW